MCHYEGEVVSVVSLCCCYCWRWFRCSRSSPPPHRVRTSSPILSSLLSSVAFDCLPAIHPTDITFHISLELAINFIIIIIHFHTPNVRPTSLSRSRVSPPLDFLFFLLFSVFVFRHRRLSDAFVFIREHFIRLFGAITRVHKPASHSGNQTMRYYYDCVLRLTATRVDIFREYRLRHQYCEL